MARQPAQEPPALSQRTSPPFRADVVGSLIRPASLLAAREARQRGEIPAERLRLLEDEAIVAAVRMQEETGLSCVTDGEFRRSTWHRDFLLRFANVVLAEGKITLSFRTVTGAAAARPPTALAVTGKIARPQPIFVDDFKFLKSIARALPKLTIPSPSILHFRGGRDAIDRAAYPDIAGFYEDVAAVYRAEIADLAAAGCRYLQIDDVNFAYLCDERLRDQVREMGEDPAALPLTYAQLINASLAARPADMAVCLHLCRGNASGGWLAEGGYEAVAETLFNAIDVTGYFLEYDSPRAGGFEPLRFLPKGKVAVLGLVSTKKPALESKDALKRRIDEAARFVPLDQLALSTQCGFSSGAHGTPLTEAEERAKLALIVEVAREVWG
jgi:5-methyltetrahydropteroyltriglutamate--homocysteine methyltransferase